MKKISEEHESEEACEDLNCSICQNIIEECYELCQECSRADSPFVICSDCDENHDPSHSLALMTINRNSKLLSLYNKPSKTQSQGSYLVDMVESMEYDFEMENDGKN